MMMIIINTIVIIVPPNPKRFEPLHDSSSNLTKTNNPHGAPAHLWPATTSIEAKKSQFSIFFLTRTSRAGSKQTICPP